MKSLGMDVAVRNLENPQKELEQHYYQPDHQHLLDLLYKPTRDVETKMQLMLHDLIDHRERIEAKREVLCGGLGHEPR